MGNYDSCEDTLAHINRVRELLSCVVDNLRRRADLHDLSKLIPPEKQAYDILTPRLRDIKYGSEEYRACLKEMNPAIQHHYRWNSHHPEHHAKGIDGMSLFDLIEMICDWKAASERHRTGCIRESLELNTNRFAISQQLKSILAATLSEMGY